MAGRLYIPPLALDRLLPDLAVDETPLTGTNLAPRQPLPLIRLEAGAPGSAGLLGLDATLAQGARPRPSLRAGGITGIARHVSRRLRGPTLPGAGRRRLRVASHASGQATLPGHPVDRGPLLLAGLWCRFHTTLTEYNDSLALITVPSPSLLSPLSDRLPAVIEPDDAIPWLDPQTPTADARQR